MFEIDKTQFGEFLASQRKRKGYTQKELAQKLFISDKAVSKWERGSKYAGYFTADAIGGCSGGYCD